MTLNDLERQNRRVYEFFADGAATQGYIIHKVAPRNWHWWRGIVGNAFQLKRSKLFDLCRARLVLRWVTACGQVNHLGAKLASWSTQPSTLHDFRNRKAFS